MLPGISHRHHGSRLAIPNMPMPSIGMLHHDGHDHHMRTVALASASAGLVVGTAAGAILFGGRHGADTGEEEPAADAATAE
jgi:hypothetical protein